MHRQSCCVAVLSALLTCAVSVDSAAQSGGADLGAGFHGFIENQGQWSTGARYVAEFGDVLVRAEPGAIVLQRTVELAGQLRTGVVRMVIEGAEAIQPRGGARVPGEFNYFYGSDPSHWRQRVPAYADISYSGAAIGADVRLYALDGHLESDFEFPPFVATDTFVVRCEGISGLAIEANGDLRMDTPLGPIVQSAPVARQVTAEGKSLPATCRYRVVDSEHFGLTVADRVSGARLIVDPGLTWGTFLGGAAGDYATRVGVSTNGNLLVVGRTVSLDFPTTPGVLDTTCAGIDVTVTCLDPTGGNLIFSTFIGGSGGEVPYGMAVSGNGSIAVVGQTSSTDFPALSGAYDTTFNGSTLDAFATILGADGSDLVLSTLIGGSQGEVFLAVAFTSSGDIVAAGGTGSANFPATPGAFDTSYNGPVGADAIVCRFDRLLSGSAQLVFSSFLGTTGIDQVLDLAMGPDDEPILVGTTSSPDFPTTSGAYDETPGGSFLTRFAADGSALVASTHFKEGAPYSVVVDGQTILVAGGPGLNLPVSPNAYDTTWNGHQDTFVARFDSQLSSLLGATYLGGNLDDNPHGIAVDPSGAIVIVGYTDSDNYPTTPGAFDTVKGGPSGSVTSMISMLSPDLSQLLYSTFLGPAMASSSWANDVVALGPADVVVVGEGAQTGFPVTPGAFDETFNGGSLGGADGYVARMLLKTTWTALGGALAGSNGTPQLSGSGSLVTGTPVTLLLRHAKPSAIATLLLGLNLLNAPFKGGIAVPTPDILVTGLPVDGQGMLSLASTWPPGVPSGLSIYAQFWIVDAAGPKGFAASNGLSGWTP